MGLSKTNVVKDGVEFQSSEEGVACQFERSLEHTVTLTPSTNTWTITTRNVSRVGVLRIMVCDMEYVVLDSVSFFTMARHGSPICYAITLLCHQQSEALALRWSRKETDSADSLQCGEVSCRIIRVAI